MTLNYNLKKIYSWPLSFRISFIIFISVALLYGAYVYDFSSFSHTFANNKKQAQDLKQQFEILYKQQTDLQDEIVNFKALNRMLLEWQKKLIKSVDLPDILNELLRLGTANGLHVNLFTPRQAIDEDIYIKVPIKINAVGSYSQIASFISQVANLQRLVVVGDFVITKPGDTTTGEKKPVETQSGNLLTLDMVLEVYQLA